MKLKKPTKARLSFKRLLLNWLILIASLGIACLVCAMLHKVADSDFYVSLIFVLAVTVISLLTDGYFYGYIIKELWGPGTKGNNQTLRVHMANIRRKIEKNPAEPRYIFTEIGVGYRMVEGD